jgi:hypothetical protein
MSNYSASPEIVDQFIAENGGMDTVIESVMTDYYRTPADVAMLYPVNGGFDADAIHAFAEIAAVYGLAVSADYGTLKIVRPLTQSELETKARQWARSAMPEGYGEVDNSNLGG